jgi:hypothetical protein
MRLRQAPAGFRGELGEAINAFDHPTVPFQSIRFGLSLLDNPGVVTGELSAIAAGGLFIDVVSAADAWRRRSGAGHPAHNRIQAVAPP